MRIPQRTFLFLLLIAASAMAYAAEPNVVVQWNEALLQGVRDSTLGPPMVARALAIAHTCAYDAWAAYDEHALGTQFGSQLRRPRSERLLPHKDEAISFAFYRAAVDLFPSDRSTVFEPLMAKLGYDINRASHERGSDGRLLP